MRRNLLLAAVSLSSVLFLSLSAMPVVADSSGAGAQQEPPQTPPGLIRAAAVHSDVSRPLREIAPQAERGFRREIPVGPVPVPPQGAGADTAVQSIAVAGLLAAAEHNFDGIGQGFAGFNVTSAPPDINGAVGTTQYVQWVNTSFAVFDKASGTLLYGPAAGNTLWTGFGGGCQANNDGDPIVQFDKLAQRWVMTQFSVDTLPYLQCVAVSSTDDALGTWARYAFEYNDFPDYPKLGVWPDAYYISFNMFRNGSFFTGGRVCAYDRATMLAGQPAPLQICAQIGSGSLLPSDLDGTTPPPAGTPNYVLRFTTGALQWFKFHVDWATPANSTFVQQSNVPVAPFTISCNGTGGTCVPQPGTSQRLDTLGDRLMYRLAYRRFPTHAALVVNHAVTFSSRTAVRWYELRDTGTGLTLHQQGTYSPDEDHRWMGSAAMDGAGNIVIGYSVSSAATVPGVRFAGREPTDPLGTLSAETPLVAGTGSQQQGLSRWGDYSSMSVDPIDDCTFWYTNQYLKANGIFNWSTRIASFKFGSCGGAPPDPDFAISTTPTSRTVVQGGSTFVTAQVSAAGSFGETVALSGANIPAGVTLSFTPESLIGGSGFSSVGITTSAAVTPATYSFDIVGTSETKSHSTPVTLVVDEAPPPPSTDFSIAATPSSRNIRRGETATYTVTVTPSGGFSAPVTFSLTGADPSMNVSFAPASVTGSGSATLTIATTASTPRTLYTLTVMGSDGTRLRQTTVSLRVR
ncbi:MAG TPA: hypothetical protein VFO19_18040 [Vicinamibacterales bacterium]|nr:hypothetical protein [Vicinamibacterales bacterium]